MITVLRIFQFLLILPTPISLFLGGFTKYEFNNGLIASLFCCSCCLVSMLLQLLIIDMEHEK